MKEQYIRQVARNLHVPRKTKMEILRDVDEAFASALEHGETEKQVMERLGTPEEFAETMQEQLGGCHAQKVDWKKQAAMIFFILISAAAFSAAFLIHVSTPASNMIGQADAATTIQIAGDGIDVFGVLILLGCVALAAAIYIVIRGIYRNNKD